MKVFCSRRCLLLAFYCSCLTTALTAQQAVKDSIFYNHVLNQTANGYQQMIGEQSRLFNGAQYAGFPFTFIAGHQFFDSSSAFKGTIVYDNILYQNVKLQYDEVADVVIVHDNFRKIELSGERVSHFSLLANQFTRIQKNSTSIPPVSKEGFYQVLYEGKVEVYKKEVKEVFDELTSDQGLLHRILVKQNYFVKKDNGYLPVNKKKDLLDIYKDKKKEIRDYISNNRLSYREDREKLIVKVSAYYDQITN